MKRIAALTLFLILLLSLGGSALADSYTGVMPPSSVLLLDPDGGQTLYEKNPDARVYPASTTKILTALVVLDRTQDLHETVTVDGSVLTGIHEGDDSTLEPMLKNGEQITVEQLLYGLLLVSGNDCAATLARHVAGSTEAFAALMNEKASSLGMADSHFSNPHGVQDESHYTTARDMGKLAAAALNTPAFMAIVSTPRYTIPANGLSPERQLVTSNRFLEEQEDMPGTACPWVTGMKTGYTPTAGGCLVTSAEKDGKRLLCLIYGDESKDQRDRWFLTKALLEFGFGDTMYAAPGAASGEPGTPAETETGPAVILPGDEEAPAAMTETKAPAAAGAEVPSSAPSRWGQVLYLLLGILLALLVIVLLLLTLIRMNNFRRHYRHRRVTAAQQRRAILPTLILAGVAVVPMLIFFVKAGKTGRAIEEYHAVVSQAFALQQAEEAAAAVEVVPVFAPQAGETATAAAHGIRWEVSTDGQTISSFQRQNGIVFSDNDYFALPGVATFRGSNYRDGGSYGTAEIQGTGIQTAWTVSTGSLQALKATWTGSGWTGQPLMAQWDGETRSHMNLYDAKKAKDGLVEVIYATLDGHVYFLDLEDGSYTRDPVDLGMAFKGAGALDPRGYPLLYVGSGDNGADGREPRMFIVSLIDGSILYENGNGDSFSLRTDNGHWCAFDSSPLVDGETDTLIWPGESGILYTIHLNTSYDKAAGTISIAPDEPVRARYHSDRSTEEKYWYGMESSAVIVDRYLYVSENGGMFFCVDLDTMELVWVQDTRDDSNSTPVYEPDGDTHGYIYTVPSLHWTADENNRGYVNIYKLDAITGDVVWSRAYDCYTVDGVSGGVQSSPVLGREGSNIQNLIIYGVSRTPEVESGLLVALDKKTGCEIWTLPMDHYAWSSPLALYDSAGNAKLLLCDSNGSAYIIDGATGQILTSATLNALVEASPAAFNNMAVVGTRGQMIYGLRLS